MPGEFAMKEHLFIYGTLLPEYISGKITETIDRLNCIGRASVEGQLYDFGQYPGAILDPSSETKVFGLVYELPDDQATLSSLDSYEGFDPNGSDDSLFVRKQTIAMLDDGRRVQCWIYVYNRNPGLAPPISDGDYQKYRAA
jgi:gamma-glutamylcyclotransferase (GGCT)/AIG2-like uncharacterized protein YtfP